MGKRKSRTRKDEVEEESSSSSAVPPSVSAKPAKKRPARGRKEAKGPEVVDTSHLSDALTDISHHLNLDPSASAVEATTAEAEEAKKGRKALLPSKRQALPLLPPPLPSSSPSAVRLTPGSKQFLTPMSSARLLAFKLDEEGAGKDAISRRLDYDEKSQPTPGRAEANLRQKQGLPLLVYCRVRPLSREERARLQQDGRELDGPCISESGLTDVQCAAPKDSHCFAMGETNAKFSFSRVFAPSCLQADVFAHTTRPLLDEAFERGQNALIFAYGLTNSGKTYTIMGREAEEEGIIPRLIRAVCERLNGMDGVEAGDSREPMAATSTAPPAVLLSPTSATPALAVARPAKLTLMVSFLEIYNERVLDLLAKDRRVKCDIQSTQGDEEVFVKGLREVEVRGVDEAFHLLRVGQAARQKAKTALNADSSRSHSVFTCKLLDEEGRVWSRMSIVDLAGSERTNRTKTESGDERRKEASNINNSLVTLGRCLEVLRANSRRRAGAKEMVPFRDSALTRLFKDSLTGSGRTVMMVNVSQVHADYDETLHALKYASIAKEVTLVAKVDSRHDVAALRRAHAAKKDLARKRMERVREAEDDEEEAEEAAEDEDAGSDADPFDDDAAPVRVHAAAAVSDSREEEILDALNEIYRLKAEIVRLQTEASVHEQQLRQEFTQIMDQQAAESEELSDARVKEERQRVAALMQKKADGRDRQREAAVAQLQDRIRAIEGELLQATQRLQEAEQRTAKEAERTAALQEDLTRLQTLRGADEAEAQRLAAALAEAKTSLRSVEEGWAAAKATFEVEKAALLARLESGAAALAGLQSSVDAEREERAKAERRERREAEEREKAREKELKAERKEADKARKEAEKERARLARELEQSRAEAEQSTQRLMGEAETEQRRATEERERARAAFEEERAAWSAEKAEQLRAAHKADADASAQRRLHDEALAVATGDGERRLKAAEEAKKAEVAELQRRIDRLSVRVEELLEAQAAAEAAHKAAVAEAAAAAKAAAEEQRRGEAERAKAAAELAAVEGLRAELNGRREGGQPPLSFAEFLAALRQAALAPPQPSKATPPLPTPPPPPSSSVVSVASFQAPAILPVGASAAAAAPTASTSSKGGILKKSAAAASKRDSMDRYIDGYDDALVQATLSSSSSSSASSSSSLMRRGKERLSSALDALRFNAHRTAPASSLHHALNEPRSVSLHAAAPPTAALSAKGGGANDGGLLSPKVQKVLSQRRSRSSRSRKGKENSAAAHSEAEADDRADDGAAAAAPPKSRKKKANAAAALSSALHATLPAPLSASALSSAAQFDQLKAAEGVQAKYGRAAAAAAAQPPPLPAAAELKAKPQSSQPTPVAKRTRQHTASK